jgi:hypothetical protein
MPSSRNTSYILITAVSCVKNEFGGGQGILPSLTDALFFEIHTLALIA